MLFCRLLRVKNRVLSLNNTSADSTHDNKNHSKNVDSNSHPYIETQSRHYIILVLGSLGWGTPREIFQGPEVPPKLQANRAFFFVDS